MMNHQAPRTSLFRPATRQVSALKAAFMGFPGSGKTTLAVNTAIGLVQRMRALGLPQGDRPVYFVDTEKGFGYVADAFEAAGVEVQVAETRAFSDLLQLIREAEHGASVLIIDSISHFWTEWVDTYTATKGRKRGPEMFDWQAIKEAWRRDFTEPYLNSPVHAILCARAAHEYDTTKDEDTGKSEIEKVGFKMQAEKNLGYEASLFVMTERVQSMHPRDGEPRIRHIAHVFKDRFAGCLDGKSFENPTFLSLLPHVERLNMAGTEAQIDLSRTSAGLVATDERRSEDKVRREIALDEIESLLVRHYPSTSGADRKAKLDLLAKHFAAGWVEIEKLMPLAAIRAGYDRLHRDLTGKPSRYAASDDGDIAQRLQHRPSGGQAIRESLDDEIPAEAAAGGTPPGNPEPTSTGDAPVSVPEPATKRVRTIEVRLGFTPDGGPDVTAELPVHVPEPAPADVVAKAMAMIHGDTAMGEVRSALSRLADNVRSAGGRGPQPAATPATGTDPDRPSAKLMTAGQRTVSEIAYKLRRPTAKGDVDAINRIVESYASITAGLLAEHRAAIAKLHVEAVTSASGAGTRAA